MDKLILIGLNHKTAPIEIRECFAFSDEDARAALALLCADPAIEEAVLLSTCNRVELILVTGRNANAIEKAKQFLARTKQVPLEHFDASL